MAREAASEAILTMDPAVFDRLTRQRHWTRRQYERWFADSVGRLLVGDSSTPEPETTVSPRRRST